MSDRVTLAVGPAPRASLPTGLRGDPLLSVRGDVAERCWEIVEPVLTAWRAGEVPLEEYDAGSDGPADWQDQIESVA